MKDLTWWRRALLQIRIHLFGPRLVTFPDRLPLIIVVVFALTLGGVALKRIDQGNAERARRGCQSYAADLALYRLVDDRVHLAPADRTILLAAEAAKEQLRAELHCPR